MVFVCWGVSIRIPFGGAIVCILENPVTKTPPLLKAIQLPSPRMTLMAG
jgi:hypothetical protein